MKVLIYIIIAVVLLVAAAAVYVRVAAIDPTGLHVNPNDVVPPSSPNYALLTGTTGSYIDVPPSEVATRLAALAEANNAQLLEGSPDDGLVTYIVRSRIMGFPDVVSIALTPEGAGTQVDLFSRSIYGYSDLGVNTARAQDWLQTMRGATVFSDGD